MKKKTKYFFWWFSSSWNEKKKIDVKKKTLQEAGMSYCPFFFLSVSHNTTSCIMTQGLTGMAWENGLGAQQARRGAEGGRMVVHDTTGWATIQATTRLRETTTLPVARALGLDDGLCHDTQFCIVTEARDWPLGVVS